MYRILLLLAATASFSGAAIGQDLMDWLQDTVEPAQVQTGSGGSDVSDPVTLLTLEPGESEMYPRIAPNGRYMLVVSGKGRKPVVTRRLVENGDPVNVVSDYDSRALSSMGWFGNDDVTFLSYRADSLGLWKKPVTGGVIRRILRIDGELRSPILLADGSVIAVRLYKAGKRGVSAHHRYAATDFNTWDMHGKVARLVRIEPNGSERELSTGVNPALSPDGDRIAFSMQAGHDWHLFMMDVDGSNLVQLTEGPNSDVQPVWSGDGKWIAFTSNRGKQSRPGDTESLPTRSGRANWDIWLIRHDGRALTRLTNDNSKDGAPAIGSNGRIYFHSDRKVSSEEKKRHQVRGRAGGFHIWSMQLPAKVS